GGCVVLDVVLDVVLAIVLGVVLRAFVSHTPDATRRHPLTGHSADPDPQHFPVASPSSQWHPVLSGTAAEATR
ncbi:hypothetical protein, partial [Corynebacterium variabile]|uniref:hypothetical protein n=1 Tax=Corynebacterium variabile TaxID=1727 RepID=UPI003F99F87C